MGIKYKHKLMTLIEVFKRRLSRYSADLKDLEYIVDKNAASPNQKQRYVDLKARMEELQSNIDLAEGLLEEDNKKA